MMWFDTRMAGEMFAVQRWFHLSVFICFFFPWGFSVRRHDLKGIQSFLAVSRTLAPLRSFDSTEITLDILSENEEMLWTIMETNSTICETYWKLMFNFRSTVQLSNINSRSGDLRIPSWSGVWGHLQPLMLDARVLNGNTKCFQHKSYLVEKSM